MSVKGLTLLDFKSEYLRWIWDGKKSIISCMAEFSDYE